MKNRPNGAKDELDIIAIYERNPTVMTRKSVGSIYALRMHSFSNMEPTGALF